ncbi:3'-5' exonuclease [Anaeromicropila herbilytica]|uniref:Exonuclease domain-containing protein n=1 Tax=Anaeromicropila herbilytica TaxID=2785025 RepID=A0A7R7EI28_9FIRM|nr:3'-5' exonuclease [Anaeromicropila herbilytica]BCN29143.1 hypothetical protein bsdtb5_04380 [Anaeromicropila herbilytica]
MTDSFVCFDIETTGLVPTKDKIIEIGALKIKDGKIVDRFQEFINPDMKIPNHITKLTGINDSMLEGTRNVSDVIKDFVNFCEDDVIIGHNIKFDYSFVKVNAKKENLNYNNKAIDTLKLAREFHSDLESKSLENMCKYYKIENQNAHRAYDDAVATTKLYFKLKENFYEKFPRSFVPLVINYKVKKDELITNAQKNYLNDLLKYHKINYSQPLTSLTKSEASKLIDRIIFEKGRIRL